MRRNRAVFSSVPLLAVAAMLLLLARPAGADTSIPLPGVFPVGLAAAPDGTFWYGALDPAGTIVGFVRPDGTGNRTILPSPFYNENQVAMMAMPDGSVLVGSYNGVIARVDPQLNVTVIRRPEIYGGVTDFAIGPDGNVWYVADGFAGSLLGTITPAGGVQESGLLRPGSDARLRVHALTSTSNGFYVAAVGGIYRSTIAGTTELVAACACFSQWIEVMADGTIWTSDGFIDTDGEFVTTWPAGSDATLGPDGNLWIAGPENLIQAIDEAGSIRDFPLAAVIDTPRAIVSAGGALWYGVPDAIRRLEPDTQVDLGLRLGDIVTREQEPNCCFEGSHPVFAHHRRGTEPFARRIETGGAPPVANPGSVYVVDPARVMFEDSGSFLAALLDRLANVTGRVPAPSVSEGAGLVLDRSGTIHAIRYAGSGCRLLTVSAAGALLRDVACPVETGTRVEAIDLAADQCTLFYAGRDTATQHGLIGRIDVCTGTMLPLLADDLPQSPSDLRVLPGGDVMVTMYSRTVRYDTAGAVVSEWLPAGDQEFFSGIALDPHPRFVWLGSWFHLDRVDLETGQTIERIRTYGAPVSISVVGEPRAARRQPKRRAAGH